ncbi:MAG: antibiotic biosynthesis monooxygenase [Verrucomicrobia bacterium]|nr:antibiotic biosynthesis monooxygenase [Verrucomicrobiota bacterium]MBS0637968.1 antibiotic biosynthesis monooxygenase [Verrucomicrobiota bacterium]
MNSVSVLVDRKVCPGNKEAFEKLLDAIILASSTFTGYIDTRVQKPKSDDDNLYRVMFRFDSQSHLDAWLNSDARLNLVKQIDDLIDKPTTLQVITGLETWFSLPGQKTMTPPPRHKMALITWIAITPLLILINYLVGPTLAQLHPVLRTLSTTPFVVLIMTYLWMPFMAKLFKRWLYPSKS